MDGSAKRRLIVDLKRSGANSHCQLPERPVLPRVRDAAACVTKAVRIAEEKHLEAEMVSADFSDEYMHFRVHPDEWR